MSPKKEKSKVSFKTTKIIKDINKKLPVKTKKNVATPDLQTSPTRSQSMENLTMPDLQGSTNRSKSTSNQLSNQKAVDNFSNINTVNVQSVALKSQYSVVANSPSSNLQNQVSILAKPITKKVNTELISNDVKTVQSSTDNVENDALEKSQKNKVIMKIHWKKLRGKMSQMNGH